MENLFFGLAGLASTYPIYQIVKKKEDTSVDAGTPPKYWTSTPGIRISLTGNNIVPITPTPSCPAGQTMVNGTCTPSQTCPAGQTLVNGTCTPSQTCPAGQTMVNGTCTCPAGQTLVNGTCTPSQTCPTGQTLVNGTCTPSQTCPAGQTLVNGICTCPAGQTLVNGTCTPSQTCPAGQTMVNGICACPAGQTMVGNTCIDSSTDPTANYPNDPLYNLSMTLSSVITTLNAFTGTNTTLASSTIELSNVAASDKLTIVASAPLTITNNSSSVLLTVVKQKLNTVRSKINTEMTQITTFMNSLLSTISSGSTLPPASFYTEYKIYFDKVVPYYTDGIKNTSARASILTNFISDSNINLSTINNLTAYNTMNEKYTALTYQLNERYSAYLATIDTFLSSGLTPSFSTVSTQPVCTEDGRFVMSVFASPADAIDKLKSYSDTLKDFETNNTVLYTYSSATVKTEAHRLYSLIGIQTDRTTFLGRYNEAKTNADAITTHKNNVDTAASRVTYNDSTASSSKIESTFTSTDADNITSANTFVNSFTSASCKYITTTSSSTLSSLKELLNRLQCVFYDQLKSSYDIVRAITLSSDLPNDSTVFANLIKIKNAESINTAYNSASYKNMLISSFLHLRPGVGTVNNITAQSNLYSLFTTSSLMININNFYTNWIKKYYICKSATVQSISSQTLGDIYYDTYAYSADANLCKIPSVDQQNRIDDIKSVMDTFNTCVNDTCNVSLKNGTTMAITGILKSTNAITLSCKVKTFIGTTLTSLKTDMEAQATTLAGYKTNITDYYTKLTMTGAVPLTKSELAIVNTILTYIRAFKKTGISGATKRVVDGQPASDLDYLIGKLITLATGSTFSVLMKLHYDMIISYIDTIRRDIILLYVPLRTVGTPLPTLTTEQEALLSGNASTSIKSKIENPEFNEIMTSVTDNSVSSKFNLSSFIADYSPSAGQSVSLTTKFTTSGTTTTSTLSAKDLYLLTIQLNRFNKIYNETIAYKSSTTYTEGNLIYYNLTLYPVTAIYPNIETGSPYSFATCTCNHPSCATCTTNCSPDLCKTIGSCVSTKVDKCRLSSNRWAGYYNTLLDYFNFMTYYGTYATNKTGLIKTTDNETNVNTLTSLFNDSAPVTFTTSATKPGAGLQNSFTFPGLLRFFQEVPPLAAMVSTGISGEQLYLLNLQKVNGSAGTILLNKLTARLSRVGAIAASNKLLTDKSSLASPFTVNPYNKDSYVNNPYESNDYSNSVYDISDNDINVSTIKKFDTFNDYDENIAYKERMEVCNGTNYDCDVIDTISYSLNELSSMYYIDTAPYNTLSSTRFRREISTLNRLHDNLSKGIPLSAEEIIELNSIVTLNNTEPINVDDFIYEYEKNAYIMRNDLLKLVKDYKIITTAKKIRLQRTLTNNSIKLLSFKIYVNNNGSIEPIDNIDITFTASGLLNGNVDDLKLSSNTRLVETNDGKSNYIEADINTSTKIYNMHVVSLELNVYGSTQDEYDNLIGCTIYILNNNDIVIGEFMIDEGNKKQIIELYDNRSDLNLKLDDYMSAQSNTLTKIRHILITRPDDSAFTTNINIKKIIVYDSNNTVIEPVFILAYPVRETYFGYYAKSSVTSVTKYASASMASDIDPNSYIHVDLGDSYTVSTIEIQRPTTAMIARTNMHGLRVQGISSFFTLIYEYDINDSTNASDKYTLAVSNNTLPLIVSPYKVVFTYPSCMTTNKCIQVDDRTNKLYNGYKYNIGEVCYKPLNNCTDSLCLNTQDLSLSESCSVDFETRMIKFRYVIIHQHHDYASNPLSIISIRFFGISGDITNTLPITSYMYPVVHGTYADKTYEDGNTTPQTTALIPSIQTTQYFFYDLGSDLYISKIKVLFNTVNPNYTNIYIATSNKTMLYNKPIVSNYNDTTKELSFYPSKDMTSSLFNKNEVSWKYTSDPAVKVKRLIFDYPGCTSQSGTATLSNPYCLNKLGMPMYNVDYRPPNGSIYQCVTEREVCQDNCMNDVNQNIITKKLIPCEETIPICTFIRVQKESSQSGPLAISYLGYSYVDDITTFSNFNHYYVHAVDTSINAQSSIGDLYSANPTTTAITAKKPNEAQYIQGAFDFIEKQVYAIKIIFSLGSMGSSIDGINVYAINNNSTCLFKRTLYNNDLSGPGNTTVILNIRANSNFYFDPYTTVFADTFTTDSYGIRTYSLNLNACNGNCIKNGAAVNGVRYAFINSDKCFIPIAPCTSCFNESGLTSSSNMGRFKSCNSAIDSRISNTYSYCDTNLSDYLRGYRQCTETDLPAKTREFDSCTATKNQCVNTDLPAKQSELNSCISTKNRCINTDLPAKQSELNSCTATKNQCVNTDLPAKQRELDLCYNDYTNCDNNLQFYINSFNDLNTNCDNNLQFYINSFNDLNTRSYRYASAVGVPGIDDDGIAQIDTTRRKVSGATSLVNAVDRALEAKAASDSCCTTQGIIANQKRIEADMYYSVMSALGCSISAYDGGGGESSGQRIWCARQSAIF